MNFSNSISYPPGPMLFLFQLLLSFPFLYLKVSNYRINHTILLWTNSTSRNISPIFFLLQSFIIAVVSIVIYQLCARLFCLYLCLCNTCVHCPWSLEKGIGILGTGLADSYEPACGCWKLTPGLLEEQPVLSTTEPWLQHLTMVSLWQISQPSCMFASFLPGHVP